MALDRCLYKTHLNTENRPRRRTQRERGRRQDVRTQQRRKPDRIWQVKETEAELALPIASGKGTQEQQAWRPRRSSPMVEPTFKLFFSLSQSLSQLAWPKYRHEGQHSVAMESASTQTTGWCGRSSLPLPVPVPRGMEHDGMDLKKTPAELARKTQPAVVPFFCGRYSIHERRTSAAQICGLNAMDWRSSGPA